MGSSDFDALSFVSLGHKVIGIKAHCLDGLSDRSLEWRAWLPAEGWLHCLTIDHFPGQYCWTASEW